MEEQISKAESQNSKQDAEISHWQALNKLLELKVAELQQQVAAQNDKVLCLLFYRTFCLIAGLKFSLEWSDLILDCSVEVMF